MNPASPANSPSKQFMTTIGGGPSGKIARDRLGGLNRGSLLPPSTIQVDLSQSEKFDERRVDLKREFAGKGLQVIVKLANIHLTPEKPIYGGGTWHVEGQLVRVHP